MRPKDIQYTRIEMLNVVVLCQIYIVAAEQSMHDRFLSHLSKHSRNSTGKAVRMLYLQTSHHILLLYGHLQVSLS